MPHSSVEGPYFDIQSTWEAHNSSYLSTTAAFWQVGLATRHAGMLRGVNRGVNIIRACWPLKGLHI